MGESPIDPSVDEVGARNASEIVMLTLRTAAVSGRDAFRIRRRVRDELIEPATPSCDRCDQYSAVLGTYCACSCSTDGGIRISRRRLAGDFRQETFSTLLARTGTARLDSFPCTILVKLNDELIRLDLDADHMCLDDAGVVVLFGILA